MALNDDVSERVYGVRVHVATRQEGAWGIYENVSGTGTPPVYMTDAQGGSRNMLCFNAPEGYVSSRAPSATCMYTKTDSTCSMVLDTTVDTTKTGDELIAAADPSRIQCQDGAVAREWKLVSPVDVHLAEPGKLSDTYDCIGTSAHCWDSERAVKEMPSCRFDKSKGTVHYCVLEDGSDTGNTYSLFYGEPSIRITDSTSSNPPGHLCHMNNNNYALLLDKLP